MKIMESVVIKLYRTSKFLFTYVPTVNIDKFHIMVNIADILEEITYNENIQDNMS